MKTAWKMRNFDINKTFGVKNVPVTNFAKCSLARSIKVPRAVFFRFNSKFLILISCITLRTGSGILIKCGSRSRLASYYKSNFVVPFLLLFFKLLLSLVSTFIENSLPLFLVLLYSDADIE